MTTDFATTDRADRNKPVYEKGYENMSGEVLCRSAQGDSRRPGCYFVRQGETSEQAEKRASTLPPAELVSVGPGETVVRCERTGRECVVDNDVATRMAFVKACKAHGLDADVWHTGGGCMNGAVTINKESGAHFMIGMDDGFEDLYHVSPWFYCHGESEGQEEDVDQPFDGESVHVDEAARRIAEFAKAWKPEPMDDDAYVRGFIAQVSGPFSGDLLSRATPVIERDADGRVTVTVKLPVSYSEARSASA